MDLKWRYVKQLESKDNITQVEKKYSFVIPLALKECIEKNNGGRPSKQIFDTDKNKERELKAFLSFNRKDKENIYDVLDNMEILAKKGLFPFANDPAGNFICLNRKCNVVLWLHEILEIEYIADTFEDFLKKLY